MNLKYYLRGLGIGIVVTSLIMGIAASGRKETLTSEEIKERARALGMVEESTVLADAAAEKKTDSDKPEKLSAPELSAEKEPAAEELSATAVPEQSVEPSPTPSPDATEILPAETVEPDSVETEAPVSAEAQESAPDEESAEPEEADSGSVIIQVDKGDGSFTVSKKLAEAGLIASAADFDRYLCQNGYDRRINVGTFEIPADAQPEQMAKILARQE